MVGYKEIYCYLCVVQYRYERIFMKYQAVKYNSREEAMAAFIKMRDRKREWLKKTENELKELRAEVETRYGNS